MTCPHDSLEPSLGQSLVQQVTRNFSSSAHPSPEETFLCYQQLLNQLRKSCLPILGRITTKVILERALVMTQVKYPFIRNLIGDAEEISVDCLRYPSNREPLDRLCEALHEFSTHLINLLALLTGEILLQELIQEISPQNRDRSH